MRCPHCSKEIEGEELEAIMAAAEVAIAFRRKQVGFGALKQAADNLERLRKKYRVD